MRERPNPEEQRARIVSGIITEIKNSLEEIPQRDQNEMRRIFHVGDFDIILNYLAGTAPTTILKIKRYERAFYWVDPSQYSGPQVDEGVVYIFSGGDVYKEGEYDPGELTGEPDDVFLKEKETFLELSAISPVSNYYESPDVKLSELNLLRKIIANPLGSKSLIKKLPLPSSWPKKSFGDAK